MKTHEELVNIIKQNCIAQDNILQSLTEANADIADVRTKIAATFERSVADSHDWLRRKTFFVDLVELD